MDKINLNNFFSTVYFKLTILILTLIGVFSYINFLIFPNEIEELIKISEELNKIQSELKIHENFDNLIKLNSETNNYKDEILSKIINENKDFIKKYEINLNERLNLVQNYWWYYYIYIYIYIYIIYKFESYK